MKRIISFLLIFVLSVSISSVAFAANPSNMQAQRETPQLEAGLEIDLNDTTVSWNNAETWAYKEYSEASKSEKVSILKARLIVMQKTSWTVDGLAAYYTAPRWYGRRNTFL